MLRLYFVVAAKNYVVCYACELSKRFFLVLIVFIEKKNLLRAW